MTDKKFDLQQFNDQFDNYKKQTKEKNKEKAANKLALLNEEANSNNSLLDKPLYGLFIGIKDTWTIIIHDFMNGKISMDTFFLNDRLFYIGFSIIIITLTIYMFNAIFGDGYFNEDIAIDNKTKTIISTNKKNNDAQQGGTIIEKHYIYA